jgi:hypothetical protein
VNFYAALQAAGMPEVPGDFSGVPQHQVIPSAILAEISDFILSSTALLLVRPGRRRPCVMRQQLRSLDGRVCFFSAWDFHLSLGCSWQLIELNDNGSGFIFAATINALYYEAAGLRQEQRIMAPAHLPAFNQHIGDLVEQEARAFFGECPAGLFLVLDDAESLQQGKFRKELQLLCDLLHRRGWRAELGCRAAFAGTASNCSSTGRRCATSSTARPISSGGPRTSAPTEGLSRWSGVCRAKSFHLCYAQDKRLLEWLSRSHWDKELGIELEERQILGHRVPETHLIRTENVEVLAQKKQEFVFKPLHGFAGRGLLDSAAVGRARMRRLARQSEGYVAQKWVPKPSMKTDGTDLWTDLRVWAYRGGIFHLSGRASRRPDRLDLTSPGGWLPTYTSL